MGFVVVAVDRYIVCARICLSKQVVNFDEVECNHFIWDIYCTVRKFMKFCPCLLTCHGRVQNMLCVKVCCHTGLPAVVQLMEMFLQACFCYLKCHLKHASHLEMRWESLWLIQRYRAFSASYDGTSDEMLSVIIKELLWI